MQDYANDFPKPVKKSADGTATTELEPVSYPSMFCSPDRKLTSDYALQTVRAIYYNNWASTQNAYGISERARMIDNRNWSNGKFDTSAFMGGKKTRGNSEKNPLMKQIDFDPVTEQSKYRDIVVGFLESLDYEITASTVNPAAAARKENFRLSEIANLRNKQSGLADKINQAAGQPIMPESNMPFPVNDEQELNMYFQLGGFKEIAELEIELGDQICNNDSDWKGTLKKMLLEDAFDTGRMIIDIEYDNDGRVRKKYVDPVNCGVEDFRGHYLKRPQRIWYIELKSVQEILMESAGQFTIEQMRTIAELFQNKFGNPAWNVALQGYQNYVNTDYSIDNFFFNFKVPIMKVYWDELDIYKVKELHYADGRVAKSFTDYADTADRPEAIVAAANAEGVAEDSINSQMTKKVIRELPKHRYYQTKWIVNTNFVYNYGRVPFQAHDPLNTQFAQCPLKYYRITQQPLAERVKPYFKKIFMIGNKIDNEVARKKPEGWVINVKALENISLGQGKTFTVKNAIEMWNETGDLLISDEAVGDEFGRTRNKTAVVPLEAKQFFNAMQGYMLLINHYKQQIVGFTGINEFMDATNPNPNTPAAVAEMAAQGSKNSMSQIASGLLNIAEKSAVDVAERIRLIVKQQGEYNGYADAIGDGILKAVSVTDAVITHRFAIRVAAKPSSQDRAELKTAVMQAFSNMATPEQGGLWVTDAMYFEELINSGTNYKIIRLMMAATIKNKLMMLQQQRQQMIEAQTQSLNNSKLTADQSELQKYKAMKQIDFLYEQMMLPLTIAANSANNNSKTANNMVSQTHKASLKIHENMFQPQGKA